MNTEHTKSTWFLGLALLAIMGVIAAGSYDQYGIGCDESIQRQTGLISFDYVFSDSTALLTWKDRDYGVAFELPLVVVERVLGLTDVRDIYLVRHVLTHAFFLVGAFFGFLLIDCLYRSKLLATIGFLLFILHPRMYAHSFFNTKDIPFMSMFLICFYLCALAFKKKTVLRFVMLGAGTGLLINLRIMGVLMVCCVLFFLAIDMLRDKSYRQSVNLAAIFTMATLGILVASWPYLWDAPIQNFVQAFNNMSKFRWEGIVLFMGQRVNASELGWNYIPVWFCITTPLCYLAAGLYSIVLFLVRALKNPWSCLANTPVRNNLMYFICFFAPVFAVIVLHSVLYDGWRQLYFIYPSFVLLLIYGLNELLTKKTSYLMGIAFAVLFASVSVAMVRYYPYQNVYFNGLVDNSEAENIRKQFDLDYWGTSCREAFDYILSEDSSPTIRIFMDNLLGGNNTSLIPANDRKRITFVEGAANADYCITLFRGEPYDYVGMERFNWHAIRRNNNTLCQIFKRPNECD